MQSEEEMVRLYRGVPCKWNRQIRFGDLWTIREKEAASYGDTTDIDFEDKNIGYTIAVDVPNEYVSESSERPATPATWFNVENIRKIKRLGVLPTLDAYCHVPLSKKELDDKDAVDEYDFVCGYKKPPYDNYKMVEDWGRFQPSKYETTAGPVRAKIKYLPKNEFCGIE